MSEDVLAVIPARGGSKRLPRKNLKELDGRPLLGHAIEHAKSASTVDRTVVSTENDEIKAIAKEYDCEVPFDRPAELATDTATADEAVHHMLTAFQKQEETTFDVVCMVLTTTPFREPADIDKAVRKLTETDAKSVVSVTDFDHPPFYAVDTDTDGFLYPYFGDEYLWSTTRSQEFPKVKCPNGAVFVAEVDALFNNGSFYTEKTSGYYMPPERSLDIDEPYDLTVARALKQYQSE